MTQRRKLGRKLLSFLLTLAMVVGLMPGMGMTTEAATIQYDDYLVEVTNHNQNFIDAGICDQTTGLKCKPLSVETAKALENYLKSKTGSKVAVIYGCTIRDDHPNWSRISFVIDGTTAENYYMYASIASAISNRGARNEAEYKLFYVNTDAPDFETANETVTFKVINGQWDDGTTEDVTVSLSGLKDEIRLAADQIPAVGTKPNDTYKAGSWDVTPSADTAITAATTYTYTYAQKESISQTVTFKVVNGSWNDETTTDKSVPLTGYEGDTLKLAATDIPAVGTKPNDTYKAGSWDVTPSADTAITAATTYTYTYAQKDSISRTVTFKVVNGKWDDDSTEDKTVTLTGYEGDTLKLTADQIPAVGTKPNDTYKAGSWDTTPSTETAITEATTYTYTYAAKEASVVTKAPEAKTLTYTGSAQALVDAGTASGGEMQYALGTATEATQPYTTSIPTGTNVGTYYVWYMVKGDPNHNSTEPDSVEAKINPVDKTDLNTAIKEAEAYYESIKEDDVYAQVAEALKNAIDEAKKYTNDNVAEKEVKEAIDTIKAAKVDAEEGKKEADDTVVANEVADAINALPASDKIATTDKEAIEAARKAYDALTDDQKAKVPAETLKKLEDAEKALEDAEQKEAEKEEADTEAAKKVTDAINALPASDKVATTDKEAIEAARKAYDALTDDQKAKVPAETLKKLEEAEKALADAEKNTSDDDKKDEDKPDYKNEWVDGQWYGADGNTDYEGKGTWKSNETGWWYEDTTGWYPVSQWQKIDGKWYYFDAAGYMASNEWIGGYWLSGNGAWEYEYIGSWKTNGTDWWYEDESGWYPVSQWQKIDGKWYYFGSDGIMATDQYIGEYWVGSDGSWQ